MADSRRPVISALRGLAFALSIVCVSSGALGWMYLLRAASLRIGGPAVLDALPLDELPRHAAVPLVLYAVTFLLGGLLLGVVARGLNLDRLTSSLVVWIIGTTWLYLETVVSIYVVRQVSFDSSFDAAKSVDAVYLGPALLALGAALFARHLRRGDLYPTLGAIAVGVLGAADFLGGIYSPRPGHDSIYGIFARGSTAPLDRTFVVLTGLLLALASRGIARRSRPAWTVAVLLATAMVAIRLSAGFDGSLSAFGILVVLFLFARRRDFVARFDPTRRLHLVWRLVGMLACAFSFGMAALAINRTAADLPFRVVPALRTTLFAFVAMTPRGARVISGGFADWFPWTVLGIAASGVAWAASGLFAPWRSPFRHDRSRWSFAREVVRASGTDSLAPFVLRADKELFLHPGLAGAGDAADVVLIAYRVVRGVAIVSGDPIGPAHRIGSALAAFLEFLEPRGWRLAILGASERFLAHYRDAGLRPIYHGDEAVLDVDRFGLSGNNMKTVRQAWQRVGRKGFTAEILPAGRVPEDTREQLRALESEWLKDTPAKGFVMELDELFRLDGDDALFVIGRDPAGAVAGFLEFAVCHASDALSLSSMPRRPDAPNGLNAFLIVEAVGWARDRGYHLLSLNFSPFAKVLSGQAGAGLRSRVERRLLLAAKSLLSLQFDNLFTFNQRFAPQWQPRYLVYEHRRHLLRIVVAAMAAERYLPFTDLLRGRDWAEPGRPTGTGLPGPGAPAGEEQGSFAT